MEGTWGVVFVRPGGRFEYGDYRLIDPQPEPEVMLSRPRWGDYVVAILRAEHVPEDQIERNEAIHDPEGKR